MKSDITVSRRANLSDRLAVELTVSANGVVAEWDPALPADVTPRELRRYIAVRSRCVAELAQRTGKVVAVVDVSHYGGAEGVRCYFPDGRTEFRAALPGGEE